MKKAPAQAHGAKSLRKRNLHTPARALEAVNHLDASAGRNFFIPTTSGLRLGKATPACRKMQTLISTAPIGGNYRSSGPRTPGPG
jgi:hypothetical protein